MLAGGYKEREPNGAELIERGKTFGGVALIPGRANDPRVGVYRGFQGQYSIPCLFSGSLKIGCDLEGPDKKPLTVV